MYFDSLKNKTVLVAGGARGIGKGLAQACVRAGAKVVITHLNPDTGQQTADELSRFGAVRAVQCDSTDRAAVDRLMDDVWSHEGPLDVVFCNAGRGGSERVLEASMAQVHDLFAANYDSALNVAQACIPRMLARGEPGHVMFTGSEHSVGLPAGNEGLGFAIYGATKHAMLIMAEWLRADLDGTPVSVSLLMPGPVLTEGLAAAFATLDQDPDNATLRAQFSPEVEHLLRERVISPERCAEIALQGLKRGLFYIPTQDYIQEDIQRRYSEMVDAFDQLRAAR